MMTKTGLIIMLIFTCLFIRAADMIRQPQKKTYIGTINNKISIRMNLEFSNNKIKGTYFYLSQKKDIELKGGMNSDGLSIDEFTNGIQTGNFTGQSDNFCRIKGKWAGGSKSFPFILEEVSNNLEGHEISGSYDLGGTASVDILLIEGSRIKFQGSAVWHGGNDNIHTGEAAGITEIKNGKAVYKDESGNVLTITFKKNSISVEEQGNFGGMNVSFSGDYEKKSDAVLNWDTFNMLNE